MIWRKLEKLFRENRKGPPLTVVILLPTEGSRRLGGKNYDGRNKILSFKGRVLNLW